ncbi:unnamed protein product [Cuscuta campestris]|uniref:Uncharacterized protein n=1 Tax=Cuscuta campestris TaxID=132261 RepID=A0A484N3J6_9ASTE|nr:unnamed protein product [Cuscuta campestris]
MSSRRKYFCDRVAALIADRPSPAIIAVDLQPPDAVLRRSSLPSDLRLQRRCLSFASSRRHHRRRVQRRHAEHWTSPPLPASFLAVESSAAAPRHWTSSPLPAPVALPQPVAAAVSFARGPPSASAPPTTVHLVVLPDVASTAGVLPRRRIAAPPVAAHRRRVAAPPLSPASVTVAASSRCPEFISPAD